SNKVVANEKTSYNELVSAAISNGSLAIAAYPNDLKTDDAPFNALEIYNVYTNAGSINPITGFFEVLWSQRSYPDLLFASFYKRPDDALHKWDKILAKRKLSATAGNDAHAN